MLQQCRNAPGHSRDADSLAGKGQKAHGTLKSPQAGKAARVDKFRLGFKSRMNHWRADAAPSRTWRS